MKASEKEERSVEYCLSNFLLSNRSRPHTTTGVTPSELFLKHNLQTRIGLFKPKIEAHVFAKQEKQKKDHDSFKREYKLILEVKC